MCVYFYTSVCVCVCAHCLGLVPNATFAVSAPSYVFIVPVRFAVIRWMSVTAGTGNVMQRVAPRFANRQTANPVSLTNWASVRPASALTFWMQLFCIA